MKLAQKLLTESWETHCKIDKEILSMNQRKLWGQAQTICENLMKKKTDVQEYIHALQSQLTLVSTSYSIKYKIGITNSIKKSHFVRQYKNKMKQKKQYKVWKIPLKICVSL